MNKKEEVSIIVPIYNVEKYVSECLQSLICQTYKYIKIYAIIDGSPDNSVVIVKEMAKADSRIICIEKENGGYGSVLQMAIEMIDSKYFLICDPDDWLASDAVESLINCALENNSDIVCGNRINVYKYANKKEKIDINANNRYLNGSSLENQNVGIAAFSECSPHSKLYRTSICKNILFEKKVNYTDFTLFMVALSNAKKVNFVESYASYYLFDRPGNSATDLNLKKFNSYIKVWYSTFEQIENTEDIWLLWRLYIQILGNLGELSVINEKSKEYYEIIDSYKTIFEKFIPYKDKMLSFHEFSYKHRLMFPIFLNKALNKMMIKLWLKYKSMRKVN